MKKTRKEERSNMKRKWLGAPAWVDYGAQFLYWLSYAYWTPNGMTGVFATWATKLLDKYCKCERCQDRKRRDLG